MVGVRPFRSFVLQLAEDMCFVSALVAALLEDSSRGHNLKFVQKLCATPKEH